MLGETLSKTLSETFGDTLDNMLGEILREKLSKILDEIVDYAKLYTYNKEFQIYIYILADLGALRAPLSVQSPNR